MAGRGKRKRPALRRLGGGSGRDKLFGGLGEDSITLRTGDFAFGGGDDDRFTFDGRPFGANETAQPLIKDFSFGEGSLNFTPLPEVGTFQYIGEAGFTASGNNQARFADKGIRQLQVDQEGGGVADIHVKIAGLSQADQLSAGDFLW